MDPNLRPISYNSDGSGVIVRGAAPDPSGRPPSAVNPSMFAWRAPADETAPQPSVAAPAPSGPVNSGPISSDRAIGSPIVSAAPTAGVDCGGCDSTSCGKRCGLLGCCDSWLSGIRSWSLFNHGCGASPACGPVDGGICCDDSYPGDRFYAKGEALVWWTRGSATPPLVTAGTPAQGFVSQGALIPGTTVLFGGNDVADGHRTGARFTAGYWFTDDHLIGIEGDYFFLGDKNGSFAAGSPDGSTQIARPVNLLGTPGRELVSGTQLTNGVLSTLAGSVGVATSSQFWGADLNLRTNLSCGPNYFIDAIAGFRTLSLDEGLSVNESLLVTSTTPVIPGAAGTTFSIADSFNTKNRFYGGQLGLAGEWRFCGKWSLGMDAKVGLGDTQQAVDISGATTTNPGGTAIGGLLTRAGTNGNIGHFTRDEFSVVPEVGLTLGYQLTDHVRLFAGYNFLYWTNVARPGNQIDTTVDPSQAFGMVNPTGANRPTFVFHNSDFWAQGVNLGLEFRW